MLFDFCFSANIWLQLQEADIIYTRIKEAIERKYSETAAMDWEYDGKSKGNNRAARLRQRWAHLRVCFQKNPHGFLSAGNDEALAIVTNAMAPTSGDVSQEGRDQVLQAKQLSERISINYLSP